MLTPKSTRLFYIIVKWLAPSKRSCSYFLIIAALLTNLQKMAHSTMTGEIQPCHSFLMAAKSDFMAHNIKSRSLVFLSDSSVYGTGNVKIEPKVCTTSLIEYNTHEDTRVTADKPYQCDMCPKRFYSNNYLRLHIKVCHIYECGTCHKQFNESWELEQHKRISTGGNAYVCRKCHKQFTEAGNLRKHELIHTGVKPYECRTCHKQFTQKGSLHRHEVIHTGIKPYECGTCHRRFTCSSNLKSHGNTHDAKRYKCETCHKVFRWYSELKKHKYIHTKPYISILNVTERVIKSSDNYPF